jgi:L-asparaginase
VSDAAPQRIGVVYTGGTIGMRVDEGPLAPGAPGPLVDHLTEVGRAAGVAIDILELAGPDGVPLGPTDSSDAGPDTWVAIAHTIVTHRDAVDAFVVLHGTDTLAYSASATSFLLEDLDRPVVFTGSQHPLAEPGSDAPRNVADAVAVAVVGARADDRLAEVVVVFGGHVLRGNRVVKTSLASSLAFTSPNHTP